MATTLTLTSKSNVQTTINDDVDVQGDISDHVVLVLRTTGTITVHPTVHGHSSLVLQTPMGVIFAGSDSQWGYTVDDQSSVTVRAGGPITTAGYLNNCTVDMVSSASSVTVASGSGGAAVDGGSRVTITAQGDVHLQGKVDGASRVEVISSVGSALVDGKVDGNSDVSLFAGMDAAIGFASSLGVDDRKVDGNSVVTVLARRDVTVGGHLSKDKTFVDLVAGRSVSVGGSIHDGAHVRILSGPGLATVTVADGVHDSNTSVTSWPPGAMSAVTFNDGVVPNEVEWADPAVVESRPDITGYWWENWGQSFGYVAPFRLVPRSLPELVADVRGPMQRRPDTTPVKAIGGGWSFTDASLPLTSEDAVRRVSLSERGRWQHVDVRQLLEGRDPEGGGTESTAQPIDVEPARAARAVQFLTSYDGTNLRRQTPSGVNLPSTDPVRLIDTRALASSLQADLAAIRLDPAPPLTDPDEVLFHVEAGITMADLQQLLDHQSPRLAIRASGGSPGATLAGVLATATHGGEHRWALLVDCVRAVHLVGPGGLEWWIEGDQPIADLTKIQALPKYQNIPSSRFIAGAWAGISGLTAADVLAAVTVSMGTMGVVYSVVLGVHPQFGIRQVVANPGTWAEMLAAVGVTEASLRAHDPKANEQVLEHLLNGAANGTGIGLADNVYVDLAINPIDRQCWIVNRQEVAVPVDPSPPSTLPNGIFDAVMRALTGDASQSLFHEGRSAGHLLDFLSYGYADTDQINNASQAARLMSFVLAQGDPMGALLAVLNAQTVLNLQNHAAEPSRGLAFVGDVLTGFFHALEGTTPGGTADETAVSYRVGAIGWPDRGIPGRGLEVALDPRVAFSFLQEVILDDVLGVRMPAAQAPLIGYVSIRVCPLTSTLMGMQQLSRQNVMIELVGYRSPQAGPLFDAVQAAALQYQPVANIPRPLLHWGLENDQMRDTHLALTPLGRPYKTFSSRVAAFRAIRTFIAAGHPQVFDNWFTKRLGL